MAGIASLVLAVLLVVVVPEDRSPAPPPSPDLVGVVFSERAGVQRRLDAYLPRDVTGPSQAVVVADDAGRDASRRHAARLAQTGWVVIVIDAPGDGARAADWVRDHRAVLGAAQGEVPLIAF